MPINASTAEALSSSDDRHLVIEACMTVRSSPVLGSKDDLGCLGTLEQGLLRRSPKAEQLIASV